MEAIELKKFQEPLRELQTNLNSMILPVAILSCLGSAAVCVVSNHLRVWEQMYILCIYKNSRSFITRCCTRRPVTGWSIGNSDGPAAMTFSACRHTVRAHTHARIDSLRQRSIFGCQTYGLCVLKRDGREDPEKGGNKAKKENIFLSCLETDLTNFFVSFYFVVVI